MREKKDQEIKQILGTYSKWYASAPDVLRSVEVMADKSPQALKAYFALRTIVIEEGALSRKVKELILLGINLVRHFEPGVSFHIKGALESGASQEEIIETIVTAMMSGAAPAFVLGPKELATNIQQNEKYEE